MVVVGVGFGLLAMFTVWTVMYWYDASTLSESEQSHYMDGKGISNRDKSFYCSSVRGLVYKCNFSKAMNQYIGVTLMGIMFLPIILTRPNLVFYVFYGTALVAFLAQLYFFKVGTKWKHHLQNHLRQN